MSRSSVATPGRIAVAVGFALLLAGCGASAGQSPAPAAEITMSDALAMRQGDPTVTIVSPADRANVASPVTVSVVTANLDLSPAGETQDGEGHLHVLVDQDCVEAGLVIASETASVHLDDGSGSIVLDMEPGRHTICVQVGDGFHIAVAVVGRISVNVIESAAVLSAVTEPPPHQHDSPHP